MNGRNASLTANKDCKRALVQTIRKFYELFISDDKDETKAIAQGNFTALLLFTTLAVMMTLSTNLLQQSWKPHDTVFYGGGAFGLATCFLLVRFGYGVAARLLFFYANIAIQFGFTLLIESAFVSALQSLVFIALSFFYLTNRQRIFFFCVIQFLAMNVAIAVADQSFDDYMFVAARMIVFSLSYSFFFAIAWYMMLKLRKQFFQTRQLLEQVESKNVALRHSQESLEQFANVVAHDLKGPLQVVAIYADLLQSELGTKSEKAGEYLEQISQSVETQGRMINDVLAYSRLDAPESQLRSQLDLCEIANAVRSDMERLIPSGTVTVQGNCMLYANRSRVRMLLQNLVENGLKYNRSETPTVTIEFRSNEEGFAMIQVTDNGIGIDESQRDSVFQLFSRSHPEFDYQGNGVGLAHCQKIVQDHLGGTICVLEAEGGGSTFEITIPSRVSES